MLSAIKISPSCAALKMIIFSIGIIVFAFSAATCANKTVDTHGGENTMPAKPIEPTKPIEEVLKAHTNALMSIPGVVGTAQGLCDGKPCIKVYVIEKTPELEGKIPDVLEGFSVEVVETGEFRALPKKQNC